jgi:hypothetical protein
LLREQKVFPRVMSGVVYVAVAVDDNANWKLNFIFKGAAA